MDAHNVLHQMLKAPYPVLDPGNGNSISIDRQFAVVPIVTTGASETRTLPAPTRAGLVVQIIHDTDGGDFTLTVTGGYNKLLYTIAVFYAAGDYMLLQSVKTGSTYRWQVVASEGVLGPLGFTGQSYDGNGLLLPGPSAKMWANCPSPADPSYHSLVHEYFNDFLLTAAGYDATNDWTYTEVDVGTGGSAALDTDATCGNLIITSGANDNDGGAIVLNQTSFEIASGMKLWYETRVKVTTAAKHIQSDWMAGLIGAGQDLKAQADNIPDNGIVFHKDDGAASLFLSAADNDTNTDSAALATTAAATWYTLGFYFDGGATGAATVTPYINTVAGTPITITYGTMAKLSPAFLYRNGEAGSSVFTIDYVKVAQMRVAHY